MAKKLSEEIVNSIVKPLIKVEGEIHPLSKLFSGKPELMPTIVSIGFCRLPDSNNYVSYTIHTKGNEVISFEVSEPNLKQIAEETSKIEFVNTFMTKEL